MAALTRIGMFWRILAPNFHRMYIKFTSKLHRIYVESMSRSLGSPLGGPGGAQDRPGTAPIPKIIRNPGENGPDREVGLGLGLRPQRPPSRNCVMLGWAAPQHRIVHIALCSVFLGGAGNTCVSRVFLINWYGAIRSQKGSYPGTVRHKYYQVLTRRSPGPPAGFFWAQVPPGPLES